MSIEFAANLAVTAANELVSTRKELRNVEDRHEKLYTEHENLKEAMLEMEKKLRQLEQTVASQDEELARFREAESGFFKSSLALWHAEKEWSCEHIRQQMEHEWDMPTPDNDKIKKLDAKYEVACQIAKLKNSSF